MGPRVARTPSPGPFSLGTSKICKTDLEQVINDWTPYNNYYTIRTCLDRKRYITRCEHDPLSLHVSSLVFLSCLNPDLQSVNLKLRYSYAWKTVAMYSMTPHLVASLNSSHYQFSATSGSSKTLLLYTWFLLSQLLQGLSGMVECWFGLVLFSQTVDFAMFLEWTPPTTF